MTIEQIKEQLKEHHVEQKAEWKTFQDKLTQQEDELKKTGKVSAETKEQLEKINAELDKKTDDMSAKMAELETAINMAAKQAVASGDDKNLPDCVKTYQKCVDLYIRRGTKSDDKGLGAEFTKCMEELKKHDIEPHEVKLMSVDSDPDGGYWVTPDTSGPMVKKVFESSPIRSVARVLNVSNTDRIQGIRSRDEIGSGWDGERQTRANNTTPRIGKYDIPVHHLRARLAVSDQLLADSSVDVQSFLGEMAGEKFARDEANAFIRGDGINKPRGILTYPNGTGDRQIQQVDVGSFGTPVNGSMFTYDGLIDIQYSLKSAYRANAQWAFPRLAIAELRKLKDDQARPLWSPSVMAGEPSQLMGSSLLEFNDLDPLAEDALVCLYADFNNGYFIVDRMGISLLIDPYTQDPAVKHRFTKRVGGDVAEEEAIKIGKLTA